MNYGSDVDLALGQASGPRKVAANTPYFVRIGSFGKSGLSSSRGYLCLLTILRALCLGLADQLQGQMVTSVCILFPHWTLSFFKAGLIPAEAHSTMPTSHL